MDIGKLNAAFKTYNLFYLKNRDKGMSPDRANEVAKHDTLACFTLDQTEFDRFLTIVEEEVLS
jgi:hypothetical protein